MVSTSLRQSDGDGEELMVPQNKRGEVDFSARLIRTGINFHSKPIKHYSVIY
jgi:hypothetical protein